MILFQQYCALDATVNDEIHRGCHLIVKLLGVRGDKYQCWKESHAELGARCSYLDFSRLRILPPACKTLLVDLYSLIARKNYLRLNSFGSTYSANPFYPGHGY